MPAPFAIFCADPLDSRAIEPDFVAEATAARETGFTIVRLDHDKLDRRIDADAALRGSRFDQEGKAVYRGWMMTVAAYDALYGALAARGVNLVTSPAQYAACHHAPLSYSAIAQWMPRTTWVPANALEDENAVRSALELFGPAPVIVKDWVKSQASGYWAEACYIPDASNADGANKIIGRFRDLQGDSLAGGLVFKAYLPLLPVGSPAHEHRAFVVGGRAVGCWPRSDAAKELGSPPGEMIDQIAASIPSPFASADFGRDASERWWLLEVGDGQVSGLPDPAAAKAIFAALANCAVA